jgi:hypothetical protein
VTVAFGAPGQGLPEILDVESEESYWYPLWPDAPGGHPWE